MINHIEESIVTSGINDVIMIPKDKFNKRSPPRIEYTTQFDDTIGQDNSVVYTYSANANRYLNSVPEFTNISQLIRYYRELELYPDIDIAINHIVMEAFPTVNNQDSLLSIAFREDSKIPKDIQKRIVSEFNNISKIVERDYGQEQLFHDWYVDGRAALYKVIDNKKTQLGILAIQGIDPINIFPVSVVDVKRDKIEKIKIVGEYYVYQPELTVSSFSSISTRYSALSRKSLVIDKNLVSFATSGKKDGVGFLHSSLKHVNNLIMLEDAAVIYRIARAPERRVFYVDVGSLPTKAANAYLKKVITENSTKISYDAKLGRIKSKKDNALPMLEDLFLPRREGSRGTEVSTLPGGSSLDQISDIELMKKNVRLSTHVPLSRFEDPQSTLLGLSARSMEISREEMIFTKFVNKLKKEHFKLYLDLLLTQLLLKKVITEDEWDEIVYDINMIFPSNNVYDRIMQLNAIEQEVGLIQTIDEMVGKYYTKEFVFKKIRNLSDEDIVILQKQIELEKESEPEEEE